MESNDEENEEVGNNDSNNDAHKDPINEINIKGYNISIKILIKKDIFTNISIDIYVNLQFLYALQNTKNFLIKKNIVL